MTSRDVRAPAWSLWLWSYPEPALSSYPEQPLSCVGSGHVHERVYAQVSHGEGHNDGCHKGPSPNQPFQGGPPALIQPIESTAEILIVFAHQLNIHSCAMTCSRLHEITCLYASRTRISYRIYRPASSARPMKVTALS
jgi:hypothetical protein